VEDLSDEELTRLKQEFVRMGDHPDDPVRKRLKKTLGRSRHSGDQGADERRDENDKDGGDAGRRPQAAPEAPPRRKQQQRQFEEYTQPLRVSQRQWT
jgi:hypothetical protein